MYTVMYQESLQKAAYALNTDKQLMHLKDFYVLPSTLNNIFLVIVV